MITRRRFLAHSSLTLAGAAVAHGAVASNGDAPNIPFRLSVMLWTLRPHYSAEQAIDLVAAAGYNGFEFVDEDMHWPPAKVATLRAHIDSLGIVCDAVSGIRTGFAQRGAASALLAELAARIPQARRLGCRRIILLSGPRDASMPRADQHAVCIRNLRAAAALAAKEEVELLLEPIDLLENPAVYLTQVEEAFALVRAVGSPHIRVLYDIYHQARGLHDTGDTATLLAPLTRNVDLLGLVHVANVPGRRQPAHGNIDYPAIYTGLAQRGYRGWLAMEFLPLGDAKAELKAARQKLQSIFAH